MVRLVLALALVFACGDTENRPPDRPVVTKYVDELGPRDRHELVQVRGTAVGIQGFKRNNEPHVQFFLEHGHLRIIVVHKGVVPDLFRNGVEAKVLGRWVTTEDVRDALVSEGFKEVILKDEVFLSHEIVVLPPDF